MCASVTISDRCLRLAGRLRRPIFTTAAKVLVKVAGGKALTFGGGFLIGGGASAAGGSVKPGAGTVVGGVVGGFAGGIAAMIGVEFALLKLEETISRTEFEIEIMQVIDEAERNFLKQLGLL